MDLDRIETELRAHAASAQEVARDLDIPEYAIRLSIVLLEEVRVGGVDLARELARRFGAEVREHYADGRFFVAWDVLGIEMSASRVTTQDEP